MNIKNKLLWLWLFLAFFPSQVFSQSDKISNKMTADTIFSDSTEIEKLKKENIELKKQIAKKDTNIKELKIQIEQLASKNSDWVRILLSIVFFLSSAYFIIKYKIIDKIIDYFKVKQEETELDINPPMQKSDSIESGALKNIINMNELNKEPFVNKSKTSSKWFVVGQSVIGKSHIENNVVCQDNCFIEDLGNNWGIAISCDGAGSAKNSHLGSKFVSEHGAKVFRAIVEKNNFTKENILPQKENWQELARQGLYQIYKDLESYSKKEGLRLDSLACTIIVVIYSPLGYLVTHIGDGRAGYINEQGDWKALIIPWKGEEANQTVFITSSIWNDQIDTFIESNVVETQSKAFTLLSDGCESHSFECSKINTETKEWSDPNLPFPKFFNPLVETVLKLKKDNISDMEIKEKWASFIESGTEGLKNEPDDKTLILGILQSIE